MTTTLQGSVTKKYTEKQLDNCRFLHLILATSGLNNPPDTQSIDYTNSCPTCKAGRQFQYPLKVTQNSMGKKKVDQNGRYGYLVFENNLVQKIKEADLSGIDFYPVEMGKDKSNFKVGQITDELTHLSEKSVIKKFEICKTCGRSGHYSNYNKVDELWYSKTVLNKAQKDFYRTWEYFGIWDMGHGTKSSINNN